MRKNLLLSVLLASACAAFAQTEYSVSTEMQKKKALLEEYTGLNCGWCPEGHSVAENMINVMGDQVFVVNIHAGNYSTPGSDEPDFRTDEGNAIHDYFTDASTGYPSGMINRRKFDADSYVLSRSQWLEAAESVNAEDAPVNLYVKSTYDGNTKLLNVHVEGYITSDTITATQYLSVLWTQDNIVAYQNGGGDDYNHMRMLRGYISPVWGEALDVTAKGSYFTKEYNIALPDSVKDVKVMPEDINIIAFVSSGKDNIENVEGGKPEYTNYGQTEAGELLSPNMKIATRYGYNFFETRLRNRCAKTITNATFEVTVNGNTTEQTIDCNIEAYETAQLAVPATITYADRGKTQYSITLKKINGVDVEESTMDGGFQKPPYTGTTVYAEITTDMAASDKYFWLKDADGNIVKEFGPYEDGVSETYYETLELEDGKTYCLEIYNPTGEGMQEGISGCLTTRTSARKLIDQFYTISGYGVRSFFIVDSATAGVNNVEITDETDENKTIYTIDGRRINNIQNKGLYIVKTKNGAMKVAK